MHYLILQFMLATPFHMPESGVIRDASAVSHRGCDKKASSSQVYNMYGHKNIILTHAGNSDTLTYIRERDINVCHFILNYFI